MDRAFNNQNNAPAQPPQYGVTTPLIPPQQFPPGPMNPAGYQGQGQPYPSVYGAQSSPPQHQGDQVWAKPEFLRPVKNITNGWAWCIATSSIFCCPITGVIALLFVLSAYFKEKKQDYQQAKRSITIAKIMSGISFSLGAFIIVVIIVSVLVIGFGLRIK